VILLHGLPQTRGLLLEGRRTRQVIVDRAKEALRTAVAHRGRRGRAAASRQARARRNHGQIARHHARSVQLLAVCGHPRHPAGTEVTRIYRR